MFTLQNTWREIRETQPVGHGLGNLFPTRWLEQIPAEHETLTMEEIAQTDWMEWGVPYWSRQLIGAANTLADAAKPDGHFCFVPLWSKHEQGWIPKADANCEDAVWLFTGNPKKEPQAFVSFAGCESVPPYLTDAVSGERRKKEPRPAVILCPGGGYEMLSYYSEGVQLAQRMERDGGYKAFILNYRIKPNFYPLPQADLALAILHVRSHAAEYGIDPHRIVIVGSSAGGHLCVSETLWHGELREYVLKTHPDAERLSGFSARPDGVGLLYPVVSFSEDFHEGSFLGNTGGDKVLQEKLSVEKHDLSDFPPTYAYANLDDDCVPENNTTRLDLALSRAGVAHLCSHFPSGGHGIGLGYGTSAERWSEEFLAFMDQNV